MHDLARIHAEKAGGESILDTLEAMPFNSLIPILIETMHVKSERISPQDLLREMEQKQAFFGVSSIPQTELIRFQRLFFQIMPQRFESVQLPPIAPLGLCTALTKLGQNERLATIRKSEVISDSTLALAVQAALRRKRQSADPDHAVREVHLAAFHRLLRLQQFDPERHWSQHFEILGLLSTGRHAGKNSLRNDTIRAHIQLWIDLFRHLNGQGYQFNQVLFTFSSVPLMEWILERYGADRAEINRHSLNAFYDHFAEYHIPLPRRPLSVEELEGELSEDEIGRTLLRRLRQFEAEVLEPLRAANPDVHFCYETDRKLGLGYYNGICFHGFAVNRNGQQFDLIDGGASDWVGQMLSDRREITVTSSFGVEIGISQFRQTDGKT